MELLCVFAALAAVFLFSAFLTLKCGLHSALAPLTALAVAVFWLTVWGMAGSLLAGALAPQGPRQTPRLQGAAYPRCGAVLRHDRGLCRLLFYPPAHGHRL